MGGHGGLNILPQKRWNVYNYENREKVRRDEEAAAREEQLKREQSRKRDSEFRLEKLRQARGLASQGSEKSDEKASEKPSSTSAVPEFDAEPSKPCDSNHMNLFEGIRIFDPIKSADMKGDERKSKFGSDKDRNKRMKKEEVRTVGPEDEKYRLGYGIAGKGVKLPWYMEKRVAEDKNVDENEEEEDYNDGKSKEKKKTVGKKSLQELREERLKRERAEKERERALLMTTSKKNGGFSSRRR